MARTTHHPLRTARRLRAAGVQDNAAITPQAQLKALDFRLGKGVGAVKERAKLAARIAAQPSAKD